MSLHGFDDWAKFVYGDIGMWVAPELNLLRDFTFAGAGPFKQLERYGYNIPPRGSLDQEMKRSKVGLEAIRHTQYPINDSLANGKHGLDSCDISPLTAYVVQASLCNYKKRRRCV